MKTSDNHHKPRLSIYSNQDSSLRVIFERAGDPRKVLCVAIDYAKRKHVALVCDGHGDVLKKPFPVENNPQGVKFLTEQIEANARQRKIPKNQIFLGGEDEPSYVANFTAALRGQDYLVMRVNAFQAKKSRGNLVANTDQLALLGIAKTLLSRRARISGDDAPPVYSHLRELARCRRSLVREQTASTPSSTSSAPDPRVKRASQTSQPGKGGGAGKRRPAFPAPGVSHHPPRPGFVTLKAAVRANRSRNPSGQKAPAPRPGATPETGPKKNQK